MSIPRTSNDGPSTFLDYLASEMRIVGPDFTKLQLFGKLHKMICI